MIYSSHADFIARRCIVCEYFVKTTGLIGIFTRKAAGFMEDLLVLGTGYALATRCYNTCFALQNPTGTVLVDAGGGNGILARLETAGLDVGCIHDLIVTHEHCDHVLGVVWMVRAVASRMLAGRYEGELTIYCHAGLETVIRTLCGCTLQKKLTRLFDTRIRFFRVTDGAQATLAGRPYTFFSIHSTKAEQYGFSMELESGARLTCLGDEPYNPLCERYARGADWLLCEAFCLYADRARFKPYEKHHSTAADAARLARELDAGHLVLWHTEDTDLAHRKARYTAEARQHYNGPVFVPDDLDVLALG